VTAELTLTDGSTLNSLTYQISGGPTAKSGTIDVSRSDALSVAIGGLAAGPGYLLTLQGTLTSGDPCGGTTGPFAVTANSTTPVAIVLTCHHAGRNGSVAVNGKVDVCPVISSINALPAEVAVGNDIVVSVSAGPDESAIGFPLSYAWTGVTSSDGMGNATFHCATPGSFAVGVTVSNGDPACNNVPPDPATTATIGLTCGSGTGGCVAPSQTCSDAGTYVPLVCTSLAGAEGRCLPSCLPAIAAKASEWPQSTCPAGDSCVPCFDPTAANPMAPTGACAFGCDHPSQPPTVLTCPWTGPIVLDPASFPACSPACGGAHCVPSSLVPSGLQRLLAACTGGFCESDDQIASDGNTVPPVCVSLDGAEGRCLSTCLPLVAARASVLPQSTCATGQKCAPCFDPTSANPTAPTGACSLACDSPKQPPVILIDAGL
jgi:hypothetical protein